MTYHVLLKARLSVTARSTEQAVTAARALLPGGTLSAAILECEAAHPSTHRLRDDFDRTEFLEAINPADLAEIRRAA